MERVCFYSVGGQAAKNVGDSFLQVDASPTATPTRHELPFRPAEFTTLTEALDYLPNQEREVVMRRFGFQTGSGLTLNEVGDILHISRERVRQIENKAKARLRRILNSRKLKRPSTSKKLNRLH